MRLKANIRLLREHGEGSPPAALTIERGEAFDASEDQGAALVKAGKASEVSGPAVIAEG